jgi:hypothetical protein
VIVSIDSSVSSVILSLRILIFFASIAYISQVLNDILDYNAVKSLCSHKNIEKVDSMVEKYINWSSEAKENPELYRKIAWRHFASEFKRKNLPIVIKRFEFE